MVPLRNRSMIRLLQDVDYLVTWTVNGILVALFLGMLGIAAAQVILRYVFDSGIVWGDPAARTLVLWVGFLGAVLTTRDNKHFQIDLLTRFLPTRAQLWFHRFSNLFAAVVCLVLAQTSISFLSFESDTRGFLNLPVAIVDVIIPAGFCLMAVQFALRMFTDAERTPATDSVRKKLPD